MNDKRLAAHRKNARKSTGPKTAAGKAASARNAIKHGVLAASPVLPGLESLKEWEEHRAGAVTSLAPVGYFENLLAERIALIAWRLRRVVRYEVEVATASTATAEIDMDAQADYKSHKPGNPTDYREKAERAGYIGEMLETLPAMPSEKKLISGAAVAALWALAEGLPDDVDAGAISIPGVPDDDAEFDRFEGWTAGLLCKCIEFYAAAGRVTPDDLRERAIASAKKECERAESEARSLTELDQKWKLRLDREIRGRMLLEPDILDKVARYENGLERSLFRNLHELQRLQAARSGLAVTPPAAVDVDLTVHDEEKS